MNKSKILIISCLFLIMLLFALFKLVSVTKYSFGGIVSQREINSEIAIYTSLEIDINNERYHRPSKDVALTSVIKDNVSNQKPEDVIYLYYSYLKEAANMDGYSGGCGTIGEAKEPYSCAYSLLSQEYQKELSIKKYINSFKGIGHISLIKMNQLKKSNNSASYFIEIEIITGKKETNKDHENISYFGYYYGNINLIYEENAWLINDITYFQEDFLCAPYHSWFYDAESLVNIIFNDNLKVVTEITEIKTEKDYIYVFAKSANKQYRFDFIRLTNGYDILIKENIMQNNQYIETNLLTEDWKTFKFNY